MIVILIGITIMAIESAVVLAYVMIPRRGESR